MNAAHWHIVLVHVPVVGALFALTTLALAVSLRSGVLFRLGSGFVVACALTAGAAYFSGGEAYELMKPDVETALVESHAVIGRAALLASVLTGVVALVGLLQELQGEQPPPALRWGLTFASGAVVWLMAWAAHLGGRIRHPEVRGGELFIFPSF